MTNSAMKNQAASALLNTPAIRAQLVRRRDEILSVVAKVDSHIGHRDEPLERDSGERALEIENLDALFAIDRATRIELRQINDAIERIDLNQYGCCSACNKPIGTARLSALPYIDTCIDCAQQAEAASAGH